MAQHGDRWPVLAQRLVIGFLALVILWFGYWEIGSTLARYDLPHWPLPLRNETGYINEMDGLFRWLTRLMWIAQLVSLVLVWMRRKLAIWMLCLAAALHMIAWIWITASGWYSGGPGFFIIIGEVLSIYALLRLNARNFLR